MAIRGRIQTDSGEYVYQVVQYRLDTRDEPYTRGASFDKLDSYNLDWIRVYIASPDKPDEGIYTHLWGPYISVETLEGELGAQMDDPDYTEAVG